MTPDPDVHGDPPRTPVEATEPSETGTATESTPMMGCGHAANATMKRDGAEIPACVICAGRPEATEIVTVPDLTGRRARCAYFDPEIGKCKPTRHTQHTNPVNSERASDPGLPFFEYKGAGSRYALETCGRCRYRRVAHENPNPLTGKPGVSSGHRFVPVGPAEFDSFYCGCWGWD